MASKILSVVDAHNYVADVIGKIDFDKPDKTVLDEVIADTDKLIDEVNHDEENLQTILDTTVDYYKKHSGKFNKISLVYGFVAIGVLLVCMTSLIVFATLNREAFSPIYFLSAFAGIALLAFIFLMLSSKYHNKTLDTGHTVILFEGKLNTQKQIKMHLFLLNTLTKLLADKQMYREIYRSIYDVQEYLRENDKKGFKSFENAFTKLGIDLNKYTDLEGEKEVAV